MPVFALFFTQVGNSIADQFAQALSLFCGLWGLVCFVPRGTTHSVFDVASWQKCSSLLRILLVMLTFSTMMQQHKIEANGCSVLPTTDALSLHVLIYDVQPI